MRAFLGSLLSFVALFSECDGQKLATEQSFNHLAKEYFLQKMNMNELRPLSGVNRCLFRKVIEHDLDILNDWRTVLVGGTYRLRTYRDPHLEMTFSFVQNLSTDSMYFIAFTHLDDWMLNLPRHYYQDTDTTLRIRNKVELVPLDNPLLDRLFNDVHFVNSDSKSFLEKQREAYQLVNEILPYYARREVNLSIVDKVEALYAAGMMGEYDYERTIALLGRHMEDPKKLVHVFDLKSESYLLLAIEEGESSKGIKVRMYLIPSTVRRKTVSGFDNPRHGIEGCMNEP